MDAEWRLWGSSHQNTTHSTHASRVMDKFLEVLNPVRNESDIGLMSMFYHLICFRMWKRIDPERGHLTHEPATEN